MVNAGTPPDSTDDAFRNISGGKTPREETIDRLVEERESHNEQLVARLGRDMLEIGGDGARFEVAKEVQELHEAGKIDEALKYVTNIVNHQGRVIKS